MPVGGYKIRNQEALHFITFAVVDWVDVFTRPLYRNIVVDSLGYCIREKGLRLHAWVIMSNHVHFIVSAERGKNLSDILRDFKKFTSVTILDAIKKNPKESRRVWMLSIFRRRGKSNSRNMSYQFWQQDNHPIELGYYEITEQKLNYIHNNPVVACLVKKRQDYLYSSARDYCGDKGMIEISML